VKQTQERKNRGLAKGLRGQKKKSAREDSGEEGREGWTKWKRI